MNIERTHLLFFSPTGTTAKIVQAIGEGVGLTTVEHNFTHLSTAPRLPVFRNKELVVLGLPVYMGRVPFAATPYLRTLKAEGTPCVIVGVYGNRAFDDFLVELEDVAGEQGFIVVAAAAFIGEHSITPALATGRPNADDLALATSFGKRFMAGLRDADATPGLPPGAVPGRRPYETYSAGKVKREPTEKLANGPTVGETCTGCGTCADVCPIDNIDPRNLRDINPYECLRCHACVRACLVGAIRFLKPGFRRHVDDLERHFSKPDQAPLLIP